jgi:hypothetical protein
VAFDTGGIPAVKDWIRPASAQLPKELLDIMGWEDALSAKAATPTYPCLIDEKHVVAELYNMVNVPQAVWINEPLSGLRCQEGRRMHRGSGVAVRITFGEPSSPSVCG